MSASNWDPMIPTFTFPLAVTRSIMQAWSLSDKQGERNLQLHGFRYLEWK